MLSALEGGALMTAETILHCGYKPSETEIRCLAEAYLRRVLGNAAVLPGDPLLKLDMQEVKSLIHDHRRNA